MVSNVQDLKIIYCKFYQLSVPSFSIATEIRIYTCKKSRVISSLILELFPVC